MAAFVVLGLGGMVAWTGMRTDVDAMNQRSVPALMAVSDLNASFKGVRSLLLAMAIEKDPGVRALLNEQVGAHVGRLSAAVSGLRGLGLASASLDEVSGAFFNAVRETAIVARNGERDAAAALLYSSVIPAEQNMAAYVDGVRRDLLAQQKALDKSLSYGGMTLFAYCLIGIAMGLALRHILLPSVAALMPAHEDELVSREIALMMHTYTGSVIMASLVTSVALVAVFLGHPDRLALYCWWAVSLGVLATRLAGYLRWFRMRDTDFSGIAAIRNFGAGSVASALTWAVFPFLFFAEATQVQRMAMAFIYAAMAGGGSAVLAPARKVSLVYLCLMLLPQVGFFAWAGTRIDLTVAVMCAGMLGLLVYSSSSSRRITLSALQLSRENKRMVEESVTRQLELENLNTRLEDRVHERTIMLELEVDAREEYALQLKELALRDPLTGLLNRRALAEQMDEVLACAAGVGMGVQVLFIDLDRFKEVNDVQGHFVGDQVLIEVAARLRAALPEPALVARWGGDEFVAVVPAVAGRNLVPAVHACLAEPIRVRGNEIRIDASIGISLSPEHGRDVDVLVRQADVAMYQAKLKGRSGSQTYDAAMGEQLRRLHELGQALREALENDALSVVFQPIVPQHASLTSKMEALLRWQHPVRGAVSPREFIAIAEDAGLIGKLGRWVLVRSCYEALSWGNDNVVSVNVSALQVMSGELLDDVIAALRESGLPAERLELELTESVFIHDIDAIARVLDTLREIGVRIAIDDFGTGYSSLSYLNRLPIDTLKIDRSFVLAAEGDGDQMLRAILGMARGFGCKVVAEGVENPAQLAMLRSLSIDYIQGNCISAPLLPDAARVWNDCQASLA
ncbi:hypothetical protein GCM10027046_02070 [Uliginosibacterium flavum]|uniref:EAL domain-containing protein n=1 Tax=Uliginosibacterium flavum TaxID=1396831 RepID=A0ABV2THL2_9RHOO